MNLLNSIKADLIEKRLWLVIVGLLAAMVAAVVFIGGGTSSGGGLPPSGGLGAGPPGPAITTAAVNPNLAISETTTGARFQRQGGAHDPFFALVGPKVSTAQTGTTGPGSSPKVTTPGSGTGSGANPPSTSPPTTTPTPSAPVTPTPTVPTPVGPPSTPKVVYRVDLQFGQVPWSNTSDAPTPDQLNAMPDINNPAVGRLLPDANTGVLAYSGVRGNGQSVTFTLKKETVPQGQGTCRPDPTNCQFVDVAVGKYETFDYQQADGSLVRYAVQVKSINQG